MITDLKRVERIGMLAIMGAVYWEKYATTAPKQECIAGRGSISKKDIRR
jgi:hypothetical protein